MQLPSGVVFHENGNGPEKQSARPKPCFFLGRLSNSVSGRSTLFGGDRRLSREISDVDCQGSEKEQGKESGGKQKEES
jgi:hypothetical protein